MPLHEPFGSGIFGCFGFCFVGSSHLIRRSLIDDCVWNNIAVRFDESASHNVISETEPRLVSSGALGTVVAKL